VVYDVTSKPPGRDLIAGFIDTTTPAVAFTGATYLVSVDVTTSTQGVAL
jgi:hypothetical protein